MQIWMVGLVVWATGTSLSACAGPLQAPSAVIHDERLVELSGIVPARTAGEYWGHNDSGHPAELIRFDSRGHVLQAVKIGGATNVDWEAMTRDGRGKLYVADVGDNGRRRGRYTVYVMPEPSADAESLDDVKSFRFKYPGGASYDCEAVFVLRGKLYVITKPRNLNISPVVFCIDEWSADDTVTARRVGDLAVTGLVTDASYSPKRKELAVLTYHGVAFLKVESEGDLTKIPDPFVFGVFGQCEAVCFDDDTLIVTNESGMMWKKSVTEWRGK